MTDDIALELYPPEYCLSDVIQQQSIRANPQSYSHLYLYLGHSLTINIRVDGHVYRIC